MANTKTKKVPQDHLKKQKKNEEALEMLVDILEPAVEIFTDPDITDLWGQKDVKMTTLISTAVKKYKTNVIRILAATDGITYEEADYSMTDIINKVMEILNNPDLMVFFGGLAPQVSVSASTSATATTGGHATE